MQKNARCLIASFVFVAMLLCSAGVALGEDIVYWVDARGSHVYHCTKSCPTLSRSKNIAEGTLDKAKAAGKYQPCQKCCGASDTTNEESATPGATTTTTTTTTATTTISLAPGQMARLYNPNSGEHFYTASADEAMNLVASGWTYEGVAWTAPTESNIEIHRLYNINGGDHHYTKSSKEKDMLVALGWKYEGVGMYSAEDTGVPIYRLYNPNATTGSHHYTGSRKECEQLVALGWRDEGIGWYVLAV